MTRPAARPVPAALASVPVLHPPLLALYRVLLLYANNMGKTPVSALLRPTLILALGAIGLWLVLWALLRQRYKAGLIASILVVASLTGWHVLEYGIYQVLPPMYAFPPEGFYLLYAGALAVLVLWLARHFRERRRVAARLTGLAVLGSIGLVMLVTFFVAPAFGSVPAWAMTAYLVLVAVAIGFVLLWPSEFKTLTATANWFALVLVGISLALMVVQRPEKPNLGTTGPASEGIAGMEPAPEAAPSPDVYVFVLSGYARGDILRQDYGFDNAPFIDALRARGFWAADQAFANYGTDVPSLASCFNMDYLDNLVPSPHAAYEAVELLDLFHHNRLYEFLQAQGYEVVVFSPGIETMEPRENVDVVLKPTGILSEFESVLLDTSLLGRSSQLYDYWRHGSVRYSRELLSRRRVLFTFDRLGELAAEHAKKPRLVLVPLALPEGPFVFDRNGDWPDNAQLFSRTEAGLYRANLADFQQRYTDQIFYTNARIEEAVGRLLKEAATDPVVVIFSSRGPNINVDRQHPEAGRLQERLGIPLLVHCPGLAPGEEFLPPGKACLVNVFRAALNHALGTKMDLLPPKAYLATDTWPMEFSAVAVDPLVE